MNEINIIRNASVIEKLKNDILSDVANLFVNMSRKDSDRDERKKNLAGIIQSSYILADKLGFSPEEIDKEILDKLKLLLVENSTNNSNDKYISAISESVSKTYRQIDRLKK